MTSTYSDSVEYRVERNGVFRNVQIRWMPIRSDSTRLTFARNGLEPALMAACTRTALSAGSSPGSICPTCHGKHGS
jgi:hypothetical protein